MISLRTRLLALFLAAGAALAVVTFFVFDATSRAITRRYAERYAAREALLHKTRVAGLVEREVALALKLADDPALRRWATAEHDAALEAAAFVELESYRRAFRARTFFVALEGSRSYYAYDPAPDRQAVRKTTLRPDVPSDRWYFDLLHEPAAFTLKVEANTMLDAVKVWVDVVLKDEAGRPIGIGGTGLDLTEFLDGLRPQDDADARVILVDRKGVLQAHWNRAYVEENARATDDDRKRTVFSLLSAEDGARLREALDAAATTSDVALTSLVLEGRRHLVAATFMEGIGWYDLVVLDEGAVFSKRQLAPLAVAMAAAAVILLAVLLVILDRRLMRPIAALNSAARAVGEGDYRAQVPEGRRDELGVLARTFNRMTATILDSTDRLQEKVEERTRQLAEANAELCASRDRMDESLRYARAIQASILPPEQVLADRLGPHVAVHLPRDVVGGDFHHAAEVEGGSLAVVVDCTGHGVPGAFVSMIASAVLRHVLEDGASDPADVLARLNRGMRQARHHEDVLGALDAGLDVLACRIDHRSRTVAVAGAGLSAFVVEGGEVREVRGDRQRVGYRGSDPDHRYAAHVLPLAGGARVYLATDGVLDQAGGPRGFGFGADRLKALLASLAAAPMPDQAVRIEAALRGWAGDRPQRDDITLLGFELQWRSPPHD